MKKFTKFFTGPLVSILMIVIAGFTSYGIINAQESQSTNNVTNVLTLDLKQLSQDPETHEFKIILSINSQIDSDRVKVTWNTPQYINLNTDKTEFVTVKKGAPTIVSASFTPQQIGSYKIEVVVELIKADVDYVSTGTQELVVNSLLIVLPEGPNVETYRTTYKAKSAFKILSIVFTAVGIVIILVISFLRWLNADDNLKYKE